MPLPMDSDEALGRPLSVYGDNANCPANRLVICRCAACGKDIEQSQADVCMDSRQMHRYVCDSKCMSDFYE